MTLRKALIDGIRLLEENNISNPRLTAEVFLSHCLNVDKTHLYTHDEEQLSAAAGLTFRSMLSRKTLGEPLQYITGIQEFFGRPFHVNPSVLIPRPETELLVSAVCDLNVWDTPRIADVGTGSGCIALTLALEIASSQVFGSDISTAALSVALMNKSILAAPAELAAMDVLNAFDGAFEFIVSNPPYVSRGDSCSLQREVRDYEPAIALFAPEDTFSVYRRLILQSLDRLVTGGYLLLEIGFGLEEQVVNLFDSTWEPLPTRNDLQGIPRVVVARKK